MYVNVLAVSEKVFLYGSLVYFIWQTRLSPLVGTLLAAGLVSFIEFAQVFIPRHVPEITDPLLIVLAALTLAALQGREAMSAPAETTQRDGEKAAGVEPDPNPAPTVRELTAVTVNLRQSSAAFLDRFSQELGVDTSAACRLIIDLILRRGDGASGSRGSRCAPAGCARW